jgi:superfamily II DNA or RNA helicase
VSYAVGSLVRARGREWVVLPETTEDLVMVRPLGGTDDDETGILTELESVEPATFDLPDLSQLGDHRSARMLRDALRLGFRSSAGPFRSFGAIAVEPRPYQLVPLLMALKLDPVRLLIADDVGIGKTVESGLIAKEMLEQGDVSELCVLCPPHLAEQWQSELSEKFHIEAELVLASTAARLERGLRVGQSLFDVHPFVIVSTDFIKSDRHRPDFLRACPNLVIVDEAHTCADDGSGRASHQRHQLIADLAKKPDRHLILVTATPHSGKEGAFRSLLELLDPAFGSLPDDLSGTANEQHRRKLAAHLVQRRRADIRDYLGTDTSFPDRLEAEETYQLSPEYRQLFDSVLAYARETVRDGDGGQHRQRVRWWSALALLRSLASSPAAAAATLRTRAASAETTTAVEADAVGRRTVLDLGDDDDGAEAVDVIPGADPESADGADGTDRAKTHRRLLEFARRADDLQGKGDEKVQKATKLIAKLVKDGSRPIVFCRFIPTAEYVAEQLRRALPKDVEVVAITGTLPPAEREARIAQMADHPKRVLVATDCLSEGINLQDLFDAVFHYDLSWNPTRHEQREGRVDRFGQAEPNVRVVTYYGNDNQIDGLVLDVLLRKHKAIRGALGVSVPIPSDSNAVVEAILEGLLLRQDSGGIETRLPGFDEFFQPRQKELFAEWENAADREKRSRTMFAQHAIKPDEVAAELTAAREAVGSGTDVARFVRDGVTRAHGVMSAGSTGTITINLNESRQALRDAVRYVKPFAAKFDLPVTDTERYLSRTDPFVESLASYVLDTALDPINEPLASRCGAIRTESVSTRTTLLLVRYRFHLVTTRADGEHPLLAEDCAVVAFEGDPSSPAWIDDEGASSLLDANPAGNIHPDQAREFLTDVLVHELDWRPRLDEEALTRADALEGAHRRVRDAARQRGVRYRVEPQLPPDVLGVYVLLPKTTVGG